MDIMLDTQALGISDAKMEIQINNDPPFVPEKVMRVGTEYGYEEIPGTRIFANKITCCVSTINYVYNGLEYKSFYRYGTWERGTNDMPRFHVRELLVFSPK